MRGIPGDGREREIRLVLYYARGIYAFLCSHMYSTEKLHDGYLISHDYLQEILHEFISFPHKKNHKLLYEACGLFLSRYSLFLRNTMRILKLYVRIKVFALRDYL